MKTLRGVETEILELLCDLLKLFKEVTVVMSTESSSSISLIRPLQKQLMELCDNSKIPPGTFPPAIHDMRQTLFNDLERR